VERFYEKNLNIRKDQEMCQSPNKFLQMISGGGAKHCLDDVKGKPCWPHGNILGLDSIEPGRTGSRGQNSRNEKHLRTSITGGSLHHLTEFCHSKRKESALRYASEVILWIALNHVPISEGAAPPPRAEISGFWEKCFP